MSDNVTGKRCAPARLTTRTFPDFPSGAWAATGRLPVCGAWRYRVVRGSTTWHEMSPIERLRDFLHDHAAGGLPEGAVATAERFLAECWDALDGGADHGMMGRKLLARTETMHWQPPLLTFRIERHGATAHGSTRAEVQEWCIDLDDRRATCDIVGHRQVRRPASRADMNALAADVASPVMAGADAPFLVWSEDHQRVRVIMTRVDAVLAVGYQQTLAGRRKRFRTALDALLIPAGWSRVPGNRLAYARKGVGPSPPER